MFEADLYQLLNVDPVYQQLLSDCMEAEQHYLQIIQRLPEQDRRTLEQYISLCEEMEHRKLCLLAELIRMPPDAFR